MQNSNYYDYTIKPSDTLSGIIGKLYGIYPRDSRYQHAKSFLLSLNPQVKNPHQIHIGSTLRIAEYPPPAYPDQILGHQKISYPFDYL